MCDCATKYMMNAKVYMGKENNEVARGLASDVVCTLVQPISGHYVCRDHISMIVTCDTCKNKDETDESD